MYYLRMRPRDKGATQVSLALFNTQLTNPPPSISIEDELLQGVFYYIHMVLKPAVYIGFLTLKVYFISCLFYMYRCLPVHRVCAMPSEARRGHQTTQGLKLKMAVSCTVAAEN